MEVASLRYPKKSHRKPILTPKISARLAEFIGIVFGDGGINNPWQVVVTVNSEKDRIYARYISALIEELFEMRPVLRKRPGQKALVIVASSTTLVDFLVSKGAVRGNKIAQQIDIPKWVTGHADLERMFVRGLVDTDGCLYIHRHTARRILYKNIGFCFTSLSQRLLNSVARIFEKNGIEPHINRGKHIYLYSQGAVVRYLRDIWVFEPSDFWKI